MIDVVLTAWGIVVALCSIVVGLPRDEPIPLLIPPAVVECEHVEPEPPTDPDQRGS